MCHLIPIHIFVSCSAHRNACNFALNKWKYYYAPLCSTTIGLHECMGGGGGVYWQTNSVGTNISHWPVCNYPPGKQFGEPESPKRCDPTPWFRAISLMFSSTGTALGGAYLEGRCVCVKYTKPIVRSIFRHGVFHANGGRRLWNLHEPRFLTVFVPMECGIPW